MNKWAYEVLYRFPFVSIDRIFGSSAVIEKLVELAIVGLIPPGRAITLGCGVGRETISLARRGFEVTGVDFSPTAIARARRRSQAAGVSAEYVVDDLTDLRHVSGLFDLVTDFGALNDLDQPARDSYMRNVLPLTHPKTHYVMFCFRKKLPPNEVDRRFGALFDIDVVGKGTGSGLPDSLDVYLMKRKQPDRAEEGRREA